MSMPMRQILIHRAGRKPRVLVMRPARRVRRQSFPMMMLHLPWAGRWVRLDITSAMVLGVGVVLFMVGMLWLWGWL